MAAPRRHPASAPVFVAHRAFYTQLFPFCGRFVSVRNFLKLRRVLFCRFPGCFPRNFGKFDPACKMRVSHNATRSSGSQEVCRSDLMRPALMVCPRPGPVHPAYSRPSLGWYAVPVWRASCLDSAPICRATATVPHGPGCVSHKVPGDRAFKFGTGTPPPLTHGTLPASPPPCTSLPHWLPVHLFIENPALFLGFSRLLLTVLLKQLTTFMQPKIFN